jgi:hypothetical protein
MSDQLHAPAALTRCLLNRWLGGPKYKPFWIRKRLLLPPGFNPQTTQPLRSPYTDCIVPAFVCHVMYSKSSRIQRNIASKVLDCTTVTGTCHLRSLNAAPSAPVVLLTHVCVMAYLQPSGTHNHLCSAVFSALTSSS